MMMKKPNQFAHFRRVIMRFTVCVRGMIHVPAKQISVNIAVVRVHGSRLI